MIYEMDDDVDVVRAGLDALDRYNDALSSHGTFSSDDRDRTILERNRDELTATLTVVGEQGGLTDQDWGVLRRHARIATQSQTIPLHLLPDSLRPYDPERAMGILALQHSVWKNWMSRFEQQTADREAFCTLHGIPDPVNTGEWIPDEPWDGTGI